MRITFESGRLTVQMGLLRRLVALLSITTIVSTSMLGDECDWTGSGLSAPSSGRGVTPVYLRCAAGRVTWLYPRGALRVLLRLPGQDRDFRACVKLHADEMERKELSTRLFLEGPRSLLPLFAHNDGGRNAIRCFNSKNGQAAIYVEATGVDLTKKRVSEMEYDLQALPKGQHSYDPSEECRPCTSDELAHAFCTSDLVTRGIIYSVENRRELDVSQLSIKVTKLIRHTIDDTDNTNTNSVDDTPIDIRKKVTLHVAQHCGVAHGIGEFVFMARRKLGSLTLQCAPRLEDWAVLVHRLSEEGRAFCVLRS